MSVAILLNLGFVRVLLLVKFAVFQSCRLRRIRLDEFHKVILKLIK